MDRDDMDSFSHVPPGFRFHPTDEELVDYYLRNKVASTRIDLDIIKDVDLYKIEPWDIQEKCKMGSEEQNEWYLFSHKDKKYPTGTRTNRATTAGFWKATGRDKPIYSKNSLVGMRKTLVFYKGRAPNGHKSDWIMHEYRLESNEAAPPQEEGWVVCRVFKKRVAPVRRPNEHESSLCWYDDHVSFNVSEHNLSAATHSPEMVAAAPSYQQQHHPLFSCKPEEDHRHHQVANFLLPHDPFLQLPQLESPNKLLPIYLSHAIPPLHLSSLVGQYQQVPMPQSNCSADQQATTDWRVLDKFVASQLSHGDFCADTNCSDSAASDNVEHDSASNSSGQIELWK